MDKDELLKNIKQDIKSEKYSQAFRSLSELSEPGDDFVTQAQYVSLLKAMEGHLPDLKKVRVAILASSTATHFHPVLKFWLAKEGFDAEIYEAEFGTIQQMVLDDKSPLYAFGPDVVFLFTNYRDVKGGVDQFVHLWKALQQRSSSHIIQNNADIPYHRIFGNYDALAGGDLHALRQFNLNLTDAVLPGVTILDMDFLASVWGRRKWHEARFWYHSKHAFDLDATGLVAHQAAKIIAALKGVAKKCAVLDLDNTLWGGVIADDGLEGIELGSGPAGEAYVEFQKYLLKLKERGIILAVCSKNEEEIAKEPFLKHPDMVLKLEDIVIFKANWTDKAANIKEIAQKLNIGIDSMVFIDDNPMERDFIKSSLPMVTVPALTSDPSDFIPIISSGCYFETVCVSDEDRARSGYYRSNLQREELQGKFSNIEEYLAGLNMEMSVGLFDDFHRPRIAQLINKSNQFHLTTTRYSESEIASIGQSRTKFGLYFKLQDRFGDNGLISAVILEEQQGFLHIDTWVMSCRVLSRGVEEFILSEMLAFAGDRGNKKLIGKYIPTAKNKLVADLYRRLNFKMTKDENGTTLWEMDVDRGFSSNIFIKKIQNSLVEKES